MSLALPLPLAQRYLKPPTHIHTPSISLTPSLPPLLVSLDHSGDVGQESYPRMGWTKSGTFGQSGKCTRPHPTLAQLELPPPTCPTATCTHAATATQLSVIHEVASLASPHPSSVP